MDKVRVGVIGCGYWGPNLIRNFATTNGAELRIIADCRGDRLKHMQSLYPQVQATTDYQDFFEAGIDAVVIATPPASHYPIAREFLSRGIHTFVEKPLTLTSETSQELVQLAHAGNLTLMTGHTFVYNTAVRRMKEYIDCGELGDVYYIDSARLNLGLFSPDLNVLWDLAPHDISILLYLLGTEPLTVQATGNDSIFPGKHDVAYMTLKFPNHILAHVHVSWLETNKVRRTTVVGSKKMLVYNDVEMVEKIKIYDKGVEHQPYTDTYEQFQCSYRYGDAIIPYLRLTEPLQSECKDFIDCIRNGLCNPLSNGLEGLKVVKILEAAQRSLNKNGAPEPIHVADYQLTGCE